LLALSTRIGGVNTVIGVWVLGVVFASCFFEGYATSSGTITLFRSISSIPVIIIAIGLTLFQYFKSKKININVGAVLLVVLIVNVFIGTYYLYKPLTQATPDGFLRHEQGAMPKFIMSDMETVGKEYGIGDNDEFVIAVEEGISDPLEFNLMYFFPNATHMQFNSAEGLSGNIPNDRPVVVYFTNASSSLVSMADDYKFYSINGKSTKEKLPTGVSSKVVIRKVILPAN